MMLITVLLMMMTLRGESVRRRRGCSHKCRLPARLHSMLSQHRRFVVVHCQNIPVLTEHNLLGKCISCMRTTAVEPNWIVGRSIVAVVVLFMCDSCWLWWMLLMPAWRTERVLLLIYLSIVVLDLWWKKLSTWHVFIFLVAVAHSGWCVIAPI